ncbi:MAG: DUF4160 domain-containing protein [Verrucomicrobiaceae bacterium]|nr:DUF4160 domain-containing protein [Verrucomicrobiaceae bacterium]
MPSVFTKNGLHFFFYSNDHAPLHVHLCKGGGEAFFEIAPRVWLWESADMTTADISSGAGACPRASPPYHREMA